MDIFRGALRPRTVGAVAALAALGLLLSACSTGSAAVTDADSGDGSAAQTTARATIDAARALPEFTLDAPAFDVTKAAGKTVVNVPITESIPYVAAVDAAEKTVAEKYGVDWINYANAGTPTDWSKGIDYGIQIGADAIVIHSGIDPQVVIPALQRAKEAGIPVLSTHTYQNGEAPPAEVADLIAATVTVPFDVAAKLEANYVVAESGCAAVPIIIEAKEVPASNGIVKVIQDELASLCPDMTTTTINVPATSWGTQLKPEVQSALTANPDADWIIGIFDDMVVPAVAGIQASGKADSVRVVSYNGTPSNVKLIQDGDVFAADMGESINWLAWAHVDQTFRVLSGVDPIADGNEQTPVRVIDDSNVDDMGTPPGTETGYGDAYIAGYESLWQTNGN
ncbi:sugar ABC transporter substrate-binding protein [Rathayibacter sp. ZW T2_19]|uniref:Sugar ABC transporter substrate-binding protein n=1 Tax=Rathayibacter rubneri TaxID=2950106 RepID=A0A9X2IQI2_9MICO|nr:sugar ABC transporter substrate-binding protein [Rathayibacter rubneri]MCM6761215.1 sugar ABC transporter substrate-binding protein [Rathayibacter rubneri]